MAYIIVILIVAILNGCLPFIDQMIDGILPLSLYAEKYMSMVSGVQMFGKLYNIIFVQPSLLYKVSVYENSRL